MEQSGARARSAGKDARAESWRCWEERGRKGERRRGRGRLTRGIERGGKRAAGQAESPGGTAGVVGVSNSRWTPAPRGVGETSGRPAIRGWGAQTSEAPAGTSPAPHRPLLGPPAWTLTPPGIRELMPSEGMGRTLRTGLSRGMEPQAHGGRGWGVSCPAMGHPTRLCQSLERCGPRDAESAKKAPGNPRHQRGPERPQRGSVCQTRGGVGPGRHRPLEVAVQGRRQRSRRPAASSPGLGGLPAEVIPRAGGEPEGLRDEWGGVEAGRPSRRRRKV